MRGKGLASESRSRSPEMIPEMPNRARKKPDKEPENAPDVYWWLRYHHLSDYYELFADMEIADILELTEKDFRGNKKFQSTPPWVQKYLMTLKNPIKAPEQHR